MITVGKRMVRAARSPRRRDTAGWMVTTRNSGCVLHTPVSDIVAAPVIYAATAELTLLCDPQPQAHDARTTAQHLDRRVKHQE